MCHKLKINQTKKEMKAFLILIMFFFSYCGIKAQTAEELIEKSFDFLEKNDLVAAEESLRAAMRMEPANPRNFLLLTNLGTIQRRQGKKEEALLSYTAGLGLHPQSITLLQNRASLYSEMKETEKAINDYNMLLIQQPDHQEALYCRGLLFLEQKNFIAAEVDFNKLLQINEKSVRARLGYAIFEKMRGNYTESEKIYNYLISEMPRDWVLYTGRAEVYFMMGKNARAMADISKVFTESKPDAYLYVLRGKVKVSQYEKDSAIKDFTTALEMGYDPEIIEELMKMAK